METLDMPLTRQQILCKALSLDPTEREELAEEIILTLPDADDRNEIDQTWLAEARKRDAALSRGESTTSTVDETIARIVARKRA